ncbi:MAG: 1-(5-phosphoribosyl)-5-[(5-phosphoribosylamino)methylideneamino]imidazole-4-carboxamide isomerase [Bacilli bacterium]
MQLYPAIDLKDGHAVRLTKGDYNQVSIFSSNPVMVALDFKRQGATFIHIVDLDGAKDGIRQNTNIIKQIIKETKLDVQVGGGIRTIEDARSLFAIGVKRLIIGTKAIEDENFVKTLISQYGDAIAIGIDVKDGFVATNGWLVQSEIKALDFCFKMKELGIKTIIYTDISKDGMMEGIDSTFYSNLTNNLKLNIIASGGVSNMDDLRLLYKLKVPGAIIGKALYLNAINLEQALKEVSHD